MPVTYVQHFSRVILSIDISTALSDEEIKQVYEKAYNLLKMYRKQEKILVLHDIGDTNISPDCMKFILPKFIEVKNKVLRRAFLIKGSNMNSFFELFTGTIKASENSKKFNNLLNALDWLVYGTDKPNLILKK
jgi:hypothetical protein